MLDRCHAASSKPLPYWKPVRKFILNEERVPQYAVVVPAASDVARVFQRMRDKAKEFTPISFKDDGAIRIQLGLFPKQLGAGAADAAGAAGAAAAGAALESKLRNNYDVVGGSEFFLSNPVEQFVTVNKYVEHQRQQLQLADGAEAAAAEAELPNPMADIVYLQHLEPKDLRDGILQPSALAAAKLSKSFYSNAKQNASEGGDMLVQDDYRYHDRSFWHLISPERCLSGVYESLIFHKVGPTFFPLHDEQLSMHFTHHQLQGESFWIILALDQRKKIEAMVMSLLQKETEACDAEGTSKFKKAMAMIHYHGKGLMPSLELLDEHRIKHHCVLLRQGEVITGRGPHFGMSVGQATTTSLATNQLDHLWLLGGGLDRCERALHWLDTLATASEEQFDAWMEAYHISPDTLTKALNQHPPDFFCAVLEALAADPDEDVDLKKHSKVLEKVVDEDGKTVSERCQAMLDILHSERVTSFLQRRWVGEGQHKHDGFKLCVHKDQEYVRHQTALRGLANPPLICCCFHCFRDGRGGDGSGDGSGSGGGGGDGGAGGSKRSGRGAAKRDRRAGAKANDEVVEEDGPVSMDIHEEPNTG